MCRQSLSTVVTDDLLLRMRWTHRLLACRTTSRGLLILLAGTQSTARSFPISTSRCSCCRRRIGDTKWFHCQSATNKTEKGLLVVT